MHILYYSVILTPYPSPFPNLVHHEIQFQFCLLFYAHEMANLTFGTYLTLL